MNDLSIKKEFSETRKVTITDKEGNTQDFTPKEVIIKDGKEIPIPPRKITFSK